MSDGWYLARGAERHGPYSEQQLREFARAGSVTATDQVYDPTAGSWIAASSVPGLLAPGPAPAMPTFDGGANPSADLVGVGVGPRLVATLIDVVLLGIVFGVLVATFGDTTTTTTTTDDGFEFGVDFGTGPTLLLSLGAFAYYWLMEGLVGGTLGKLAVGLRVRSADGGPASLGQTAIRTVLRIIDGFFLYLVAVLVVSATPRKQRIGDLAAKTVVVRR